MNTEEFEQAFAQGVRLFGSYYTENKRRSKDPSGEVPLTLFGGACIAYDISQVSAEFSPSLRLPYLPGHILKRSWHGEFAL